MIIVKIYLGNFSGVVEGSVGSFEFQIVPCSSLYLFSRSIGPLQCIVNVNYRVLTCCTCHFQSSSHFFILDSSFCKSLQCLISALIQEGEGGHLFRLICSVVLWGGRDTANTTGLYFWGGSKITADGDCSHEIKRCLLLGRKVITNLDSILKAETLLCQQRSV